MISWVFWKSFGDLCLYFSVVSAVPALFPHSMSFVLPVLLGAIGVTVAAALTWQGRSGLRMLGLGLPLLGCFLAGSLMEWLILLPAVVYCGVLMARCDFHLEYYDFREGFVKTLWVWCCGFLIVAIFHGLETRSDGKHVLAAAEPLGFGLLWMLSGVVLCRNLRMGLTEGKKPWSAGKTALMLGASGAVLAGAVGLERFLQSNATSLTKLLGNFFILVLGLPGQLFSRFVNWVLSLVDKNYLEFFDSRMEAARQTADASVLPTEEAVAQAAPKEGGFPWWLAVLVLAALALVLIWMLKQFRTVAPVTGTQETRQKVINPGRTEKTPRRSNRSQVRKYYRSFLKAEKKKGLRLHPSQTSADILRKVSEDTDRDAAERLRQVYLAARYDNAHPVTKDQVEQAREALKQTQEKRS